MRKNLWRKWIAAALSLCICLSLAPLRAQAGQGDGADQVPSKAVPASFDKSWDLNDRLSDVSISKSGTYFVTDSAFSTAKSYGIEVHGNDNATDNIRVNIYIEHVNIDSRMYVLKNDPAIEITGGANVYLYFCGGTSMLNSATGCAAIQKDSTSGELGVFVEEGSEAKAYAGKGGAAIGGGTGAAGQNIIINGGVWKGTLRADAAFTGSGGAGIGGGANAAGSNISINGGTVTAIGTGGGAGIGGGANAAGSYLSVNDGIVSASSTGRSAAAGIGGGAGAPGSYITVSGGTLTATGGTTTTDVYVAGAGIGGGSNGLGSHITISGGTTTATGGTEAAGVGGGSRNGGSDITISGGTLTANGTEDGAGIGGGNQGACARITITGGNVTANGGKGGGAGIGGGYYGAADTINISGGSVTANGSMVSGGLYGGSSAAIGGGGGGNASNINISGGTVHACIRNNAYCFSTYDPIAIGRGCGFQTTSQNVTVTTDETHFATLTIANSVVEGVGGILPWLFNDTLKVCGSVSLLALENPALGAVAFRDPTHGNYGKYIREITIEFTECAHRHSYQYSQSYTSTFNTDSNPATAHTALDYHYEYCTICGAVHNNSLAAHTYQWDAKTHEKKCTLCGFVYVTEIFPPVIQHTVPVEPDGSEITIGGDNPSSKVVPIVSGSSFYQESAADKFTFTVQKASADLKSVKVDGTEVSPNEAGEYSITPDDKLHTITADSESGLSASVTIGVYRKYEVKIVDTTKPTEPLPSLKIGYGQPCPFTFTQPANTTYVKVEVVYDEEDHKVYNMTLPYNISGQYTIPAVLGSLTVYLTPMKSIPASQGSISIPGHTWTTLADSTDPVYLKAETIATLSVNSENGQASTGDILYVLAANYFPTKVLDSSELNEWHSYLYTLQQTDANGNLYKGIPLMGQGPRYLYVRLSDTAGNVSYISSPEIVIDSTAPKAILYGSQTELTSGSNWVNEALITVDDATPCTVTLGGATLTPSGGVYHLPPSGLNSQLCITDFAGNQTTYTLTIHENKLTAVGELASLPVYPNGTTLNEIALPAQVGITTSLYKTQTASIVWDKADVKYDFSSKAGGSFAITGKLVLPNNVANPDQKSINVSLNVTIQAAPIYNVTVRQPDSGGTLSADTATAYAGDAVTVTVTPSSTNWQADTLLVLDSAKKPVVYAQNVSNPNIYTYRQPSSDSTVSAEMNRVQPELQSVTQPADIGDLPNGTGLGDISLPETAVISTTDGGPASAAIQWNKAGIQYDFTSKKGGTFQVGGTVVLPDTVFNPSSISLAVSLNVTILEAPKYAVTATQPAAGGTLSADTASTYAGETVTVTAKPDAGYQLSSVRAVGADGSALTVTGSGNRYTYQQPACVSTISAVFVPIVYNVYPSDKTDSDSKDKTDGDNKDMPDDVSDTDWFHDAVQFVREKHIMNSTGNNDFDPYAFVSRGTLSTVLYRLAGSPDSLSGNPFRDVASGSWYEAAIRWAAQIGIAKGSGGGLYQPDAPLTREQAAVLLYRFAALKGFSLGSGADLSKYSDSKQISAYARSALAWACGEGLFSGRPGGVLDPRGTLTRCELAALLARFCMRFGL